LEVQRLTLADRRQSLRARPSHATDAIGVDGLGRHQGAAKQFLLTRTFLRRCCRLLPLRPPFPRRLLPLADLRLQKLLLQRPHLSLSLALLFRPLLCVHLPEQAHCPLTEGHRHRRRPSRSEKTEALPDSGAVHQVE
jgi:hypothetical protein